MKWSYGFVLLFCGILLCSSMAFALDDQTIEVTVVERDCLINISKKYLEDPRRWRKIARINHLADPDLIYPGQRLIFPVDMLRGTPVEGSVTFLKGTASVREKAVGEWRPLHAGDTVGQGSGISTARDGAVEITFEDGSSFYLRPGTTLNVNTAEKKGPGRFIRRLYLNSGKTISRLREATGSDSRFEIHTPSAVAAARGTEFRVSVDDAEATRSEVLRGTIGVQAMKQEVEVNRGEGTLVRMNEPPLPPRRLLPAPELVGQPQIFKSMPLRFRFRDAEGAASLRIILSRDTASKDILREEVVKPGQTAEMSDIDDGVYFLQGVAIDADGLEGMPSEPAAVRVRVNPVPPFVQAPLDSAECLGKSVEFRWLKVEEAVRYHLQIAEDREFSKKVADRDDIAETSHISTLPGYRTYYYKISSIAEDGYEGAETDSLSFSVAPPAPPLEKPEIGDKEIHIRWRDMGEGVTYHFQMARDAGFREIVADQKVEGPETTVQRPEKAGTYFVRTSSIDSKGHESAPSAPQSFGIKPRVGLGPLAIIGAAWLIILLIF